MPFPRPASTLAALLCASLLFAACGGDDELSKQEYSQQVGDALSMLADGPSIRAQIEAADGPEALATNLEESQAQLEEVSDALSAIDAPADAAAINDDLIAATDDLIAAIGKVIVAAQDPEAAEALTKIDDEFQAATETFQGSLDGIAERLDEAGFPPPPSASASE